MLSPNAYWAGIVLNRVRFTTEPTAATWVPSASQLLPESSRVSSLVVASMVKPVKPVPSKLKVKSLGPPMLNGATLALEEANKKDGYNGIPYKLMIHNDVGLWGAAANEVVKMDDEKVWAWLGSIDDIVSHVALRATLKMEMMMVNTGDPDPTLTETNIPWVIRVISDDRQSGYALASYIFEKMGHERVAVIRTNSRYGRVGIMEYSGVAVRLGHPMMIELRFDNGETDFKKQLEKSRASRTPIGSRPDVGSS